MKRLVSLNGDGNTVSFIRGNYGDTNICFDVPNKEKVYKPGDIITLDNGKVLKAVLADTDGSGCYVCDDGVHKCYFLDKENCPKCHSSEFYLIDYVGSRVIFIEYKQKE